MTDGSKIPPWHDFAQHVVERFPLPIAHEMKQALDALDRPRELYVHFLSLIRTMVSYCGLIMLSQYKGEDRHDVTVDPVIVRYLGSANPRLQDCHKSFFSIVEYYRQRQWPLFVSEFISLLPEESGECTQYQRTVERLIEFVETPPVDHLLSVDECQLAWDQHIGQVVAVLHSLQFLKDYSLLRLLGSPSSTQGGFLWNVQVLTGAKLAKPVERFLRSSPQQGSSLALIRSSEGQDEVLYLYPFVIFWQCQMCQQDSLIRAEKPEELFMYERMEPERKQVVYVGLRNTGLDEHRQLISEPFKSLSDWLDSLRPPGPPTEKSASASEMIRKSRAWTADQLAKLGTKYDKEVYLQRESAEDHFQAFLKAAQSGLLVVGNSGSGKTNLLCHLAQQRMEHHPEDIVLLYSCLDLHDQPDLAKRVASDLGVDLPLHQLLEQLDEWFRRSGGHFLLLLDALNEHDRPESMLRWVNDSLLLPCQYAWLKVVVSCRSESWEQWRLKDIPSPNLYYRPDGELALRLVGFSEAEVPQAYASFQKKYGLLTDFAALSAQAQHLMQDPFMLWLVAEGYAGQAVPADVGSRKVFTRYLKEKIGSTEAGKDLGEFYRQKNIIDRLVTLMRDSQKDYLVVANLVDDPQVGQQVLNRTKGAPYMELLDESVLMEFAAQEPTTSSIFGQWERRVKFVYDRLFEFLLAEHTMPTTPTRDELVALVHESREYPSLWGAVKVRLTMAPETGPANALLQLAELDEPEVRSMAVDALTTMAGERPTEVKDLLEGLLRSKHEAARLVAILTAYNLDMTCILALALDSPSQATRSAAALYAYYFWERNNAQGEDLVRGVSQRMGSLNLRLNLRALRSFIEMSTFMSVHLLTEPEVTYPFIGMWGDFLRTAPLRASGTGGVWERSKRAGRWQIIKFGAGLVLEAFRSEGLFNLETVGAFFSMDESDRRRLAAFAAHIDPQVADVGNVEDEIFTLAQVEQLMFHYVITAALIAHSTLWASKVLKTLQRLLEDGNTMSRFTATRVLGRILYAMAIKEPSSPLVVECSAKLREYVLRMWSSPDSRIRLAGREYGVGADDIFVPLWYELRVQSSVGSFIDDLLRTPLAVPLDSSHKLDPNPEIRSIVVIIRDLGSIGAGMRSPELCIRLMQRWFTHKAPQVSRALAQALARIRNVHPVEVDGYLSGQSVPSTLLAAMRQVQHIPGQGEAVMAGGERSVQSFLYLPGGPKEFARIMQQMLLCKDIRSWAAKLIEGIIDVAQGMAS